MRFALASFLLLASASLIWADEPAKTAEPAAKTPSVYDFTVKDNSGADVKLDKYKGKVLLIVNVASKCGNTPQYKQLEEAYKAYHDKGFEILAFPANEFGHQEPGTDAQIKEFCTSKYNVTFDLFSKIVVKGEGIAPLYHYLTSKETDAAFAGDIKWNFAKFLVNRDGKVVARFDPKMKPDAPAVVQAIEAQLNK